MQKLQIPVIALALSACTSSQGIIDRSTLRVSKNSRVVANNVIPNAANNASVVEHLGLAQEVYQSQMTSLKRRKRTLRSRGRTFSVLSYGTFVLTTMGVGVAAVAVSEQSRGEGMRAAGFGALSGAAVGTLFQIAGYMQEDPASVDHKIRRLEGAYSAMVDQLRSLGQSSQEAGLSPLKSAAMSQAIEAFITHAVEIDVRG